MVESSPPNMDIKVLVKGSLLGHFRVKSFRSRQEMTVQKMYVDEDFLRGASEDMIRGVRVVHIRFQGYSVWSLSPEAGKQVYALSTHGTIVVLSLPRAPATKERSRRAWREAMGLSVKQSEHGHDLCLQRGQLVFGERFELCHADCLMVGFRAREIRGVKQQQVRNGHAEPCKYGPS